MFFFSIVPAYTGSALAPIQSTTMLRNFPVQSKTFQATFHARHLLVPFLVPVAIRTRFTRPTLQSYPILVDQNLWYNK